MSTLLPTRHPRPILAKDGFRSCDLAAHPRPPRELVLRMIQNLMNRRLSRLGKRSAPQTDFKRERRCRRALRPYAHRGALDSMSSFLQVSIPTMPIQMDSTARSQFLGILSSSTHSSISARVPVKQQSRKVGLAAADAPNLPITAL